MAEGASVPPLGLSNKAVCASAEAGSGNTTQDTQKKDQFSESYFTLQHLTGFSTLGDILLLTFNN